MTKSIDRLNAVYRYIRNIYYCLLDPVDLIFRKICNLDKYPPISLRRHSGHIGLFETSFEYVAYLKLFCGLNEKSYIMDLGCGCGLLELALESSRWKGFLVGMDIHKPSIRWLKNSLSKRVSSYKFIYADIYNPFYNRLGKYKTNVWLKKFNNKLNTKFDILIAKSFFTHILPNEINLYITYISKKLKPGGRALLTFFLRDNLNHDYEKKEKAGLVFTKVNDNFAVRYLYAPSAAVLYKKSYIFDLLKSKNLKVLHYFKGVWNNNQNGLSYQDLLIISKVP